MPSPSSYTLACNVAAGLLLATALWAQIQSESPGSSTPGGTATAGAGGQPGSGAPGGTSVPGQGTGEGADGTVRTVDDREASDRQSSSESSADQWQVPRILYLQGRVVTDTGEVPREPAVVKMRCGGRPVPQGLTDLKGRFSIQPGGDSALSVMDASVRGRRVSSNGRARGSGNTSVTNCELLVELPGYRSSILRLDHVPSFGIHQVGTIVLYGHKGVTGETVSATTLMAPSSASKAYRKGLRALHMENPNYTLSIKHLQSAVEEYQDYAAAWASLAEARMASGDWAGAREAFLKSIEADPQYLKPYEPFISASFDRRDWTTVDSLGGDYLKLHPEAFQVRAMSAEAAVRLGKYDRAAELTKIMADRDEFRHWPITYVVAGLVHESRSEFNEAAVLFREYLNHDSESLTAKRLLRTLYEWQRLLVIDPPENGLVPAYVPPVTGLASVALP